jgi:cell division protein FtsN
MKTQRGAFVLGLVVGLLIGLALSLGVALYITRAPIPFVNKVPQRTAEQDSAEAARNRSWDPNAGLAGRPAPRAASGAVVTGPTSAGPVTAAPATPSATPSATPAAPAPAARAQGPAPGTAGAVAARDPAAILSGGAASAAASPPRSTAATVEPFVYFVQAGAFTRSEEAEQQKAKLALMGHSAGITEREQAGRTVYRVRLGPMRTRDEADALQVRLQTSGMETQIVRVEKP